MGKRDFNSFVKSIIPDDAQTGAFWGRIDDIHRNDELLADADRLSRAIIDAAKTPFSSSERNTIERAVSDAIRYDGGFYSK